MQIAFPKPINMKCVAVAVNDSALSTVALRHSVCSEKRGWSIRGLTTLPT